MKSKPILGQAAPEEKNSHSPIRPLFVLCSLLNILWNFLFLQGIVCLFLLNVSLLCPQFLPAGQIFVLDSGHFIDDLYYYGSGPEEIDEAYLKEQRFLLDISNG